MTFAKSNEMARSIVEVFEDFLEKRGIDVPNPDKAQSEGPSVIYGADYGELVDRVAAVLFGKPVPEKTAPAVVPAPSPVKIQATFAATVPLAVRLLEEAVAATALRKPTTWQVCATGKGENEGKKCRVRLLEFRNSYEIQVDNEIGFASSYHRVCDGKTIVAVQQTLNKIQRDVENGFMLPF